MNNLTYFFNSLRGKVKKSDYEGIEFWKEPERSGWLDKQGEKITTWRKRWFVLKQGKIFWFETDKLTPDTVPRGIIEVSKCLSIRGAEDAINKPCAFSIATPANMYFIAPTDKEKEDWINSVGRAIVKHSRSMLENDQGDYTSR